jgi:hypothetical protein
VPFPSKLDSNTVFNNNKIAYYSFFVHCHAVCNTEFLTTVLQCSRPARAKKNYEAFTSRPLSDNSLNDNKVSLNWRRNKICGDLSHLKVQNTTQDGKHTKVEFSL